MNSEPIARAARRLRLLVVAGIGLVIAVYLIGVFGPELGPVRVQSHSELDGSAGLGLITLTLLPFVAALARLAQMLDAIAAGPLFGPKVTRAFRGFAFWLFVAILVDVLAEPIVEIIRRASAGGGRAVLAFELRDLLMLAGTLFLFLLARMMEQARAIEAELEEIV